MGWIRPPFASEYAAVRSVGTQVPHFAGPLIFAGLLLAPACALRALRWPAARCLSHVLPGCAASPPASRLPCYPGGPRLGRPPGWVVRKARPPWGPGLAYMGPLDVGLGVKRDSPLLYFPL